MNYSEPIRLAGTALQNFFSDPNTIKGIVSPAAYAITNSIIPETHNQEHSNSHELMQMQQMHAELEQQRYSNEINLALAKNYHAPTEIVHRNPSADLQTAYNIMTPNVSY
jgi:hypothetical protein